MTKLLPLARRCHTVGGCAPVSLAPTSEHNGMTAWPQQSRYKGEGLVATIESLVHKVPI